jgi:hypothetical protein
MKITRLFLLVAIVTLFSGCTSVPSQDAARIRAAYHTYLSIGKGMPHTQVVSLLGNEIRHDNDGAYFWEVRYDSGNFASIRIRFDSGDRVHDTLVTRAWGFRSPEVQSSPAIENEH